MTYDDLDRFFKDDRVIIECTNNIDSCGQIKSYSTYLLTRDISDIDEDPYLNVDLEKIYMYDKNNSIILMSKEALIEPGEIYVLYQYVENIEGLPVFLVFSKTNFFKQLNDFHNVIPSAKNSYFKIRKGIKRVNVIKFYMLEDDFPAEDDFQEENELVDLENIND